jgi:hypothetical protein
MENVMLKPREHEQVDESFISNPKYALSLTHKFRLPREVVWAGLKDADTWTKWLPLNKVTWTSPEPFAVGTTRTVEFSGQEADEYFFVWEEGFRMAFRFSRSSVPVAAFAEEYSLRDVEGGCLLTLKSAVKTNGLVRVALKPFLRVILKHSLRKMEHHLQKNLQYYVEENS